MALRHLTVLIDTREQDPWMFRGRPVYLKRATLKSGDYSVHGCSSGGISIERKALPDLFGTMLSGIRRFENEMQRLSEYKSAYLLIEAPIDVVRRGTKWSQVNGGRLVESVFALCAAYSVHPVFCRDRVEAEEVAYHLLLAHKRAFGSRV